MVKFVSWNYAFKCPERFPFWTIQEFVNAKSKQGKPVRRGSATDESRGSAVPQKSTSLVGKTIPERGFLGV